MSIAQHQLVVAKRIFNLRLPVMHDFQSEVKFQMFEVLTSVDSDFRVPILMSTSDQG